MTKKSLNRTLVKYTWTEELIGILHHLYHWIFIITRELQLFLQLIFVKSRKAVYVKRQLSSGQSAFNAMAMDW